MQETKADSGLTLKRCTFPRSGGGDRLRKVKEWGGGNKKVFTNNYGQILLVTRTYSWVSFVS